MNDRKEALTSINNVMGNNIYQRHKDVYYKMDAADPKVIHVVRNIKDSDCKPYDYSVLDLPAFFKRSNNRKFANICPSLFVDPLSGSICVYVQIHCRQTGEDVDFILLRDTLGSLLGSIAEMCAGDEITDRGGNSYIFGKPINLDSFYRQFMLQMMNGDNAAFLEHIRSCSTSLKGYCKTKTRGIGSVIHAVNRLTKNDLSTFTFNKK